MYNAWTNLVRLATERFESDYEGPRDDNYDTIIRESVNQLLPYSREEIIALLEANYDFINFESESGATTVRGIVVDAVDHYLTQELIEVRENLDENWLDGECQNPECGKEFHINNYEPEFAGWDYCSAQCETRHDELQAGVE